MKQKDQINLLVQEISGSLTSDSLTFIKIRLQHNAIYKSLSTGGGNFLMTLGLLSTLGFLAKVYCKLSYPDFFTDDRVVIKAKKLKKKMAESRIATKKELEIFRVPRIDETNEEMCFVKLIDRVQEDNITYMGLNNTSAQQVWRLFRNKLAHISVPRSPVAVYDKDLSTQPWHLIEHEISKTAAFKVEGDTIFCNPDKLTIDVRTISIWLCSLVDSSDRKSVFRTLKWLKSELF